MRSRVLLVESETLIREGLERLLADEFDVVAKVADLASARVAARGLAPQVVVAGLSVLPAGDWRNLSAIGEEWPHARVVVVGAGSEELAARGFASGALGWVVRSSSALELRAAVRAAAAGRSYLTKLVAGGDIGSLPRVAEDGRASGEVTPRAFEVLRLLAEGKGMKEIAADLGISARTVAFHKYRTMRALGIDSSAGLVRYAVRNHVV